MPANNPISELQLAPEWACPRCRGPLDAEATAFRCAPCGAVYPVFEAIPDFRVGRSVWIDVGEDRRFARELVSVVAEEDSEETIRFMFRNRGDGDVSLTEKRVRRALASTERLERELSGWLESFRSAPDPLLEVGCGPGMLPAAAAKRGRKVIGIDVSLVLLVAARRLVRAAGGSPQLAAGEAETLPFRDGSIGAVTLLDMIEHVDDPAAVLREIDRVLRPGGALLLATPNRFSLAAEPHVGLWGVGWLPRRWQAAYVQMRSGLPYRFVRLVSARELQSMFRECTSIAVRIEAAPIPAEEIAAFSPRRVLLARIYNALLKWRLSAWLLRLVGPFLHVVGRKELQGGAGPPRAPRDGDGSLDGSAPAGR